MHQSPDHAFELDLTKELPSIISAFESLDLDHVAPQHRSTVFLIGINIILKTSQKNQKREEVIKFGWKLLEEVRAQQDLAQSLVHPNLTREILTPPQEVTCTAVEKKQGPRWTTEVSAMAVKQRDVVPNNKVKAELVRLEEMIRHLHETSSSHAPPELVQWWCRIINTLANDPALKDINNPQIIFTITQEVEVMMQHFMDSISTTIKEEVVFSILKHLYTIISKPGANPNPATSIVLSVIQPAVINSAIMFIIKSNINTFTDPNEAGIGLRNALSVLCRWLCVWPHTPVLREWILSFMKGLQEFDKCDVLVDVSMEVITPLFTAIIPPSTRELVSDIFFYILSSMRHCIEPFEKIALQIPKTLELLACDSQKSRQLLQNLVDTLSSLLDEHVELKNKYPKIVQCLDAHIRSNTSSLFSVPLWKITPVQQNEINRIGLTNMGNTCYMNSVLQALLNTRQFSNRIVLNREKQHLMMSLGSLFAMMTFSIRPSLCPREFYAIGKPPSFTRHGQQDSSEFLCYLLDTLHEQEKAYRLDRSIPNVQCSSTIQYAAASSASYAASASYASYASSSSMSNHEDDMSFGDLAESTLINSIPIEEASTITSLIEAGPHKRSEMNDSLDAPMLKRKFTGNIVSDYKFRAEQISSTTIVQKTFGGIFTTSIQCDNCKVVSKKRDIFRDLQLAFPDNPMANKPMHNKEYTVQELLNYYCSPEKMSGDNQYKCEHCNTHRDAERSITIDKAPKNLILVLKRFLYDPKTQVRAKLLTQVEHNRTVTITVGNETLTYELYAAVVHSGSQLDLGHYYTYARDTNQNWYKYNDHWVTRCSEKDLHDLRPPNTPYILFYKQLDISNNFDMETAKEGTSAEVLNCDSPKPSNSKCEVPMDEGPSTSNVSELEEAVSLEKLPQHLIEHIMHDNSLYLAQNKRETRNTRSNIRNDNYRRDPDDDPSSSYGGCGDLPENYSNRYIY